jgi:hypothetical protein
MKNVEIRLNLNQSERFRGFSVKFESTFWVFPNNPPDWIHRRTSPTRQRGDLRTWRVGGNTSPEYFSRLEHFVEDGRLDLEQLRHFAPDQ